ncbi:MAG: aminoacyl-histidine dipeptidase [Eubacteriales bacterium]
MSKYLTDGYKPEALFRFFEEISAIPRGSKNEAKIADYLEKFAGERGLFCYRDKLHNVLIKAPATAGYEKEPAVLLQGHTDMVCEKNSGTRHDFLYDPLELYIEGDWLRARGTTLGADNGVAVALMLALLDGGEEHPAIECLFTVQEEIGLIGAGGFDYSLISARRMINLDSEGEGQAVVGCAGGCRTDIRLPYEPVPATGEAVVLKLGGLAGGHSGMDIGRGRTNAIKLMGRLLLALRREVDYNIISIDGGLAENAIPRECEAVLAAADASAVEDVATRFASEIPAELSREDSGFSLACSRRELPEFMMSAADTKKVAAMLASFSNGVIEMSRNIPGLVEYSRNLGIVRTHADKVCFAISMRSSLEARIDVSCDYLSAFAGLCGAEAEHHSRYPGWKFDAVSPLRDKYIEVCRRVLGREPQILTIHAGLECGIIKAAVPDMDIISIGPTIKNIHTPDEALNLPSYERFWQIVTGILEK